MLKKISISLVLGLFMVSDVVFALANANLTEMSLEDLMNVEITSISKTPQVLSKTPAAVSVISNDDIRRSGRTAIADLLRQTPGVQVGNINSNIWGVSIRGFNDRFANKLLVMMDGRSVYTPLFSGVFWSLQDTLFEDIDRVEVVRGPGGTAWGANAVNGVINIITKPASETQGIYAAGGYGTYENGFADVRYGGKVNDNLHYRIYNKYYNRDKSFHGEDDWEAGKGGGRADWKIDDQNDLTVQGDMYAFYGYVGSTDRRFNKPVGFGTTGFGGPYDYLVDENTKARGRNVLARWTHKFSDDSDLTVQGYYDFTYLGNPFISEARDTYDVDARYRFPIHVGVPQEIILGGGYRYTSDKTIGSYEVQFNPANRSTDIISWSAQDEIRLIENFLTVWVGSKFEQNDYTGFEYQPTARVAIYPDSKNTVWGSITRAVRTPSRADSDVNIHLTQGTFVTGLGSAPVDVNFLGNKDFVSEELLSYEGGLKSQVTDTFNADIAAFYNEYDNLRTAPLSATSTSASFITTQPILLTNRGHGETYGTEVSLKYHMTEHVRFTGSYSYLHIRIHPDPDLAFDSNGGDSDERESPNHQASGGISLDLPWNVSFDSNLRYVGELSGIGIGEYIVADMRVGWKPNATWEFSVVGINLFQAHHEEFNTPGGLDFLGGGERVRPSVYGKAEARF